MKFSANLGFLFTDRPLPDAIRAAADCGFDAVECHWPFEISARRIVAALREAGLPMVALNTRRGGPEEMGLGALPGREGEAQATIDQAIAFAAEIGCGNVHVMAGFASGPDAFSAFAANLDYACRAAEPHGLGILIEPLNARDVPGYFLSGTAGAVRMLDAVGAPNLKIMFDCYHMQIMQGDLLRSIAGLLPDIGHIQFASVPDRGEPDGGEVDYGWLLPRVVAAGYAGAFGAEYRPRAATEASLDWLARFRAGA